MKIGIDCTRWDPTQVGGINTFVLGLINGFLRLESRHSFIIFCNETNHEIIRNTFSSEVITFLVVYNKSYNFIVSIFNRLTYNILGNFRLWAWFMNIHYRRNKEFFEKNCDLLYCPQSILPLFNLKIPTVLSIHDIQHEHFPEFFSKRELKYRKISYTASAIFSTYIQASSNFIKNDLLEHYNIPEKKIIIIKEGVDLEYFQNSDSGINPSCLNTIPERYLFYPAQHWKHKNHINLLRALKILKERENIVVPLIITGRKFSASETIFKYIDENNLSDVKYIGPVSSEIIRSLYNSAWYLILPTLFESSSLPVLEASACGLPIMASDIPSIAEMNSTFYITLFDPLKPESISEVILEAWTQGDKMDIQICNNKIAVKSHIWSIIASQYIDLFEFSTGNN